MSSLIYIAQPIDQSSGFVPAWVRSVVSEAEGIIGFHPAGAFTVGPAVEITPSLEGVNRAVLDGCDGLVAVLPAGMPTIGVPREIEAAIERRLPVAVVTDANEISFALADVDCYELTPAGMEAALAAVRNAPTGAHDGISWAIGDRGRLPTRAHASDAGFDLFVSEGVIVRPGQFVDIHTDVRVAMPPSMWGRIVGRSSTRRKRGLLVIEGVIDAGYRGPIYTGVHNLSDKPVEVRPGERLAQFIPHLNVAGMTETRQVSDVEFDAIPHDGRGTGGFGSSGQ